MRRDKNDEQWQEVKKLVARRDRGCRLLPNLSPVLFMRLVKNAGNRIDVLDPAHVIPVSTAPHMVYHPDNIVLLNRFSHDALDSMKDPITGASINREQRDNWWIMIVGDTNYKRLVEMSLKSQEKVDGTEVYS